jgi:hypothetical protein
LRFWGNKVMQSIYFVHVSVNLGSPREFGSWFVDVNEFSPKKMDVDKYTNKISISSNLFLSDPCI